MKITYYRIYDNDGFDQIWGIREDCFEKCFRWDKENDSISEVQRNWHDVKKLEHIPLLDWIAELHINYKILTEKEAFVDVL